MAGSPVVPGLLRLVFPERLGTAFRWLMTASWVAFLGEGIGLAAGPLLVASVTSSPALVALAVLLQRLPWLLLGLFAGVVADRRHRLLIVLVADGARLAVVGVVVLALLTGTAHVALVLGATFLIGVAETFSDTASPAMLPMLVGTDDLGIANARQMGGAILGSQLVGPPVGALLFTAGREWPFVAEVVLGVLALMMLSRVRLPPREPVEPGNLVADIRAGLGWLWASAPVRTLTLAIVTFNITFGAAWSVLVLYAREQLGLGSAGFGLITTVTAVGGLLATASYGRIERRFSLGTVMRAVLLVETFLWLGLALVTNAYAGLGLFFVFGIEAFVWGTTSRAVRQRAVPDPMQGRINSVYMLGVMGGIVVGSALGGAIAQVWGITAPYWFAFGGSAVILALIWRQLPHVAHAEAE